MAEAKATIGAEGARLPLTIRQHQVLSFIFGQVCATGSQPTYREIQEHFGVSGPNALVSHMGALQKKGWIRIRRARHGVEFLFTPAGKPFLGFIPIGGASIEAAQDLPAEPAGRDVGGE